MTMSDHLQVKPAVTRGESPRDIDGKVMASLDAAMKTDKALLLRQLPPCTTTGNPTATLKTALDYITKATEQPLTPKLSGFTPLESQDPG